MPAPSQPGLQVPLYERGYEKDPAKVQSGALLLGGWLVVPLPAEGSQHVLQPGVEMVPVSELLACCASDPRPCVAHMLLRSAPGGVLRRPRRCSGRHPCHGKLTDELLLTGSTAAAPLLQVAFEAAKAAQRAGIDVLLVDTAGRMQVGSTMYCVCVV